MSTFLSVPSDEYNIATAELHRPTQVIFFVSALPKIFPKSARLKNNITLLFDKFIETKKKLKIFGFHQQVQLA